MELSSEQARQFEERGFFVLRGVFSAAELATLRPGPPAAARRDEHAGAPPADGAADADAEAAAAARCIVYGNPGTGEDPAQIVKLEGLGRLGGAHPLRKGLHQTLCGDAALASAAKRLLGARAELMKDKFIFKAAGVGGGFVCHQDMTFMMSRCATEVVNFGIAFDDADEG